MKGQRIEHRFMHEPAHWREALAKAKEEFGKIDNCLGVNYCQKRQGGVFVDQHAIVVYVRKKIKEEEKIPPEHLIRKGGEFKGIPTDVVEVFSQDRLHKHLDYIKDHDRSHDLAALNFGAIHRAHLGRGQALPDIGRTGTVGEVFIIEDPDGRLITEENGEEIPDLVEAYKVFRQHREDVFDFVTFFSDVDTGMPTFDISFHLGVYNDIQGIGRPSYDYRGDFGGSNRLQSVHFIHHTHFNRYVMLQEVGHRWCAFVAFQERPQGPLRYDLLAPSGAGAFSHWDILFDDDRSPVDYDEIDWAVNPDDTFRYVTVPHRNRHYCNLDLYLMGLLQPNQVGAFYYLRNIRYLGGQRYAAERRQLQIQNVIWGEGERRPVAAEAQKAFRQAFVLLTRNYDQATSLAETVDRFRREYTNDFAEATGNRASVDTTLGRDLEAPGGYIYQEYHRQLSIPDKVPGDIPSIVESTLSFAEDGPIKDIEVALKIIHTYIGDLRIALTGPDGTEVVLHNQAGGGADNLEMTYKPNDVPELQNFIGKSAKGDWMLRISDVWSDDTGHLESWRLKLNF